MGSLFKKWVYFLFDWIYLFSVLEQTIEYKWKWKQLKTGAIVDLINHHNIKNNSVRFELQLKPLNKKNEIQFTSSDV